MFTRRPPIGFLFLTVVLSASLAQAKVYRLYYLGGQSNMDGYGRVKELPGELNRPVQGVMIFHGNTSPDGTAPGRTMTIAAGSFMLWARNRASRSRGC